jgi:hypothetical protein
MMIEEHDYVRLADGGEGTVVCVFSSPGAAYEIELSPGDGEMIAVSPEKIGAVLWSAREKRAPGRAA